MSSKRRRGAARGAPVSPSSNIRQRGGDPSSVQGARRDWRWRTFPVFAAFSFGLLVAFLVNEGSANPVAFVVQIGALLGVGYSLAHLVVSNIVASGNARRGRAEDDTEDVVVYPDEE